MSPGHILLTLRIHFRKMERTQKWRSTSTPYRNFVKVQWTIFKNIITIWFGPHEVYRFIGWLIVRIQQAIQTKKSLVDLQGQPIQTTQRQGILVRILDVQDKSVAIAEQVKL